MTIKLYAFTCGWITLPLGVLLEGEKGMLRTPIPAYLIEHPKGRVLFDSGLSPAARDDFENYMGRLAKSFKVEFGEHEDISARLAQVETGPGDIDFLINSHLHFDHAGGNAQIPEARVVVQRPEWAWGTTPEALAGGGYKPQDFELGHDVMEVAGEHDLFGDGTVTCLPTYGHTPGHQSLRVRLEGGDVVLAADACYLCRSLEEMRLPGYPYDREAALESLRLFARLRDAGARIFVGHDPDFWEHVPQAPAQIV